MALLFLFVIFASEQILETEKLPTAQFWILDPLFGNPCKAGVF